MRFFTLAGVAAYLASGAVYAASPAYLANPVAASGANIIELEQSLNLGLGLARDTALTIGQRRDELGFAPGSTEADIDNDLSNISAQGSRTTYLFKALTADQLESGVVGSDSVRRLSFDVGSTGSLPNLPLLLDLGEYRLDVADNLELQGAHLIATLNSNASSDGAALDGMRYLSGSSEDALQIDSMTSGRVVAGEFLDVASGVPINTKILLDLNSTFKNGASYEILQENAGTTNVFGLDEVLDSSNSRLFDTSYIMNSSIERAVSGGNESVVVIISRDDEEYIDKAATRNHPSDNAARTLGRIATDGVALGDMQTALTLLELNDYGYGDNQQNLAVEVKRLAPIANNSHVIAHIDSIEAVTNAVNYRVQARRGNWSGYRDANTSLWVRTIQSDTRSSGSVPIATPGSQDNAGHDGFTSRTLGGTFGLDRRLKHGLVGFSYADLDLRIRQGDDRTGENSTGNQQVATLYARINGRYQYLMANATRSTSTINGVRKTAVGRTASHAVDAKAYDYRAEIGRRFDLSDGRTALTPYVSATRQHYEADPYQETGAGALNLAVSEQYFVRQAHEFGLSISHKRRFLGAKTLVRVKTAISRDARADDLTISARYTGDTHTVHSSDYTAFTTPAEVWSREAFKASLDLQYEVGERGMLKLGLNSEARSNRQRLGGEFGFVWVF